MRFDELDVSKESNEKERLSLDGLTMIVGNRRVSLDGQWVDIYSTDSDHFHDVNLELQRRIASGEKISKQDIHAEISAAMIAAWSFEEPCTKENRVKAAKIWPKRLLDLIDKKASSRVNFTYSGQSK